MPVRGNSMKVAIVDDEYYALENLRIKLSALEDVEIVGMYEDSVQFLKAVDTIRPDLVLLDIEMPKLNGFQVLAKLKELEAATQVIFVTAYSHYGAQISATDAVDYMVKPVTLERLEEALTKASNRVFEMEKREQ